MAAARLSEIPAAFVANRDALHAVAEQIISPARAAATGDEFSLIPTPGGFGTPPLPGGGCVRVEALELVVERAGAAEQRAPLTSLRESASAVGLPSEGLGEEGLSLDSHSAAILADSYLLADGVLRAFSAEAQPVSAATENQLWPEHFDIAIEHGAEPSGQRASYGLSPGDAEHPEPYFYVAPWNPLSDLAVWNATGFAGAELGWGALLGSDDPHATALEFFRERRDALHAG